ncbi:SRPBCC family protein [Micromonospora sagamiensis]|uniref:Uncharacterized protein YndB with AHSA1/START domain n=1 Tax=Micromonospora sagamiensis TaxID=47875 RepID=A0A562WEK9_9ACTN|nr:SRPBCC domain-containing protein [Micromonospora sagamiensis]TWJ28712.1 uncharacterized protein YndB with AHSA1/START domain [Micromonospora sagamiensis]BCL12381.1 hypothetical protein GCM10017556_01200 [Micromonospora sagamiensis]
MPLLSSEMSESVLTLTWAVEAPAEAVWERLTTPSLLPQWLGELVEGEVTGGSPFVVDHGGGYRCASTVTAYDPGRLLAYTWEFPDEPRTEVSWTLSHDESVTTVRLAHDGLGDLAASYRDGWTTHLMFLEASALGDSLPTAMFWQIHATIARLNARGE